MGFGTALHYVGTVMLLVATVFMVVASIGPPAVNDLNLLSVDMNGASGGPDKVYYGVFGYCTTGADGNCSGPRIGYSPAGLVDGRAQIDIGRAAARTTRGLTHAFVLHPIAGAVSFVAFLLSLKTGFLNLITTLVAVFAFFLAIINLAIDFACFIIIRHDVNDDSDRAKASFGPAIWLVVGAAIANLIGAVIVFVTCCAGRRRSKYENRKIHGGYNGY
ncbi:SUR7/PalI family protein [Sarocladium implicatum]|nr:SUR7/PalI family protein [Sarocladium implicatum]